MNEALTIVKLGCHVATSICMCCFLLALSQFFYYKSVESYKKGKVK